MAKLMETGTDMDGAASGRANGALHPAIIILARFIGAIFCIWLIAWSLIGLQFDLSHLQTGIHSGSDYVARMFPHSASEWHSSGTVFKHIWPPLEATIQMTIFGTVLGSLFAFPVSFLAARTSYVPWPVSTAVKTALNMARAVPTMVYALIAVSAIGLGPSAGAIAIAFGTFVWISKLYAEALESVSVGPIEAVRAAGGNGFQVFVFGMLPQVFPLYLSTTLYSLEYNFKDSSIVGIVGAGGLGFELLNNIRLYKLLDAGVIIAVIILCVNIVDYTSYRVRRVFS